MDFIPVNTPLIGEIEKEKLIECIESGWISSEGPFVSEFENRKPVLPYLLRYLIRALLILLRSIPEIVWALIFVRVVGLGPTAGILAISLTYGGMLGKVYAEILESGDNPPGKYGIQIGCSRLQVLLFFLIPQNLLELVSYTVYRWECAIRSTVIMGFVGAGGLGFQLESALKMFAGDEVLTILCAFISLVWMSDCLSKFIRKILYLIRKISYLKVRL